MTAAKDAEIARLTAALAASEACVQAALAGVVRVRELEWEHLGRGFWMAKAPLFGTIRIDNYCDAFTVNWSAPGITDTLVAGKWATEASAKAAAQAHFDAATLANIVPDTTALAASGRFTDLPSKLRRVAQMCSTQRSAFSDGQRNWAAAVSEDAALKIEALERDATTTALDAMIGAVLEEAAQDVEQWADEDGEATIASIAASIRALRPDAHAGLAEARRVTPQRAAEVALAELHKRSGLADPMNIAGDWALSQLRAIAADKGWE